MQVLVRCFVVVVVFKRKRLYHVKKKKSFIRVLTLSSAAFDFKLLHQDAYPAVENRMWGALTVQ